MNNKIKQLAAQARRETYDHFSDETFDWDVWHTVFQHKFAELIIREYSYDVINVHGAKPEYIQFVVRCWGVEV